jgi:hypothetical protein
MAGGAELDALKHEMREGGAPKVGAPHEISPAG